MSATLPFHLPVPPSNPGRMTFRVPVRKAGVVVSPQGVGTKAPKTRRQGPDAIDWQGIACLYEPRIEGGCAGSAAGAGGTACLGGRNAPSLGITRRGVPPDRGIHWADRARPGLPARPYAASSDR